MLVFFSSSSSKSGKFELMHRKTLTAWLGGTFSNSRLYKVCSTIVNFDEKTHTVMLKSAQCLVVNQKKTSL